MKIGKAIEEINDHLHSYNSGYPEDLRRAIKLGLEALKGILELRRGRGKALSQLLPGETED